MTERKPPGVPFESWVDKQIREAEARGEFASLAGAGKPLPSLDEPYDEMWWIRGKMRSEGLAYLPPALRLRKEAEDAMAAVAEARSERRVREILAEINEKIEAALRRPPPGPLLNLKPFDVERIVVRWREEREDRNRAQGDGDGRDSNQAQGDQDGGRTQGGGEDGGHAV
ncbi:DUF1992 domain-containing protein [Streptomyces sp. KK5PA1]|uniref:DUF1992 domain-containing protein n=1 Tax=Actinacidiphila acididurans TaxID=2784346 RepID=A0ABS2TR45_9ACTN|nr:DUF1992 domain-containing protein [Actinacidiphila acididurans]